jgi:3-oxoacyl-[acyl-carrier-protein] synthase-3
MSINADHTSIRYISILGTGHALPKAEVYSDTLDIKLGHPSGYIEKLSGVRKRYVADVVETAAVLGAQAALGALDSARMDLTQIDCLIAASGTMDQGMPSNAALIHHELGLKDSGIPAFDINASCLGFLAALDNMTWAIAAGRYQRILIVSSDIASCGLNWKTLESSAIFGDGAAAAVIGRTDKDENSRILGANFETYSSGVDYCKIPGGGTRYHPSRIKEPFAPLATFRMNGKGVFKLTSAYLPNFVTRLLKVAGLTHDELDWIVPHQGSHLALSHLTRRLGFKKEKVIDIFSEHGNQVAASLPTALDIAIKDSRIRRGQRILLIGTGAGLSIGGMVLEY